MSHVPDPDDYRANMHARNGDMTPQVDALLLVHQEASQQSSTYPFWFHDPDTHVSVFFYRDKVEVVHPGRNGRINSGRVTDTLDSYHAKRVVDSIDPIQFQRLVERTRAEQGLTQA